MRHDLISMVLPYDSQERRATNTPDDGISDALHILETVNGFVDGFNPKESFPSILKPGVVYGLRVAAELSGCDSGVMEKIGESAKGYNRITKDFKIGRVPLFEDSNLKGNYFIETGEIKR
jgi:hypothetical protein